MAVKFIIERLEDVTEGLRSLYVKREDGKYQLDAEGAADKSKLDEFRTNNIELLKKLDVFKDIDPKKYAELMETDQKVREKKLIESGQVEQVINERVALMRNEHSKELKKRDDALAVANRQLETLLIDNQVKSVAVQHGVLPTAMDDLVLRAKAAFSIHEGAPVMKDTNGNIVYGEDGTTPLSIDSWAKKLKTTAPHLFAGFTGSGAPGGRGGAPGAPNNASPVDKIAAGLAAGLAPRLGGNGAGA